MTIYFSECITNKRENYENKEAFICRLLLTILSYQSDGYLQHSRYNKNLFKKYQPY